MAQPGARLGLVTYVLLIASLATPLYGPYATADETWVPTVVIVAAHAVLGLSVRRWLVLVLPVAFALAAFLLSGAQGLAWLILFFGAPALIAIVAIAMAIGKLSGQHARGVMLAVLGMGLLPAAGAAALAIRHGPHVPDHVQAQLPTEISLGNLCAGDEIPPAIERDIRRRARVLLRELRLRPDHLATYTFYYADDPEERRDITIRALARLQLEDLESGGDCDRELERRIRDEL